MDEITTSRLTIEIGASSDNARQQIRQTASELGRLRGYTNQRIRVDATDVDRAHKRVSLLTKTLDSMKRIAFYRVIRSAIKAIGDAMQEGQSNAYWYAKTMGDSTKYIADAYDRLSSGGFKLQNQLGAAWATLKATITPILIEIANLATMAAQAITQLFAALGGKGTYLKAVDYSKQWAENTAKGAGAAKEWRNQLMGFDEINRLEEPSKGGGGGGSALPDYENMFDTVSLDGAWKKLSDLFSKIKFNIKDVLFNWDDLNPENIAKKAIVGLSAVLGAGVGFIIGGVPGAVVGTILGVGINWRGGWRWNLCNATWYRLLFWRWQSRCNQKISPGACNICRVRNRICHRWPWRGGNWRNTWAWYFVFAVRLRVLRYKSLGRSRVCRAHNCGYCPVRWGGNRVCCWWARRCFDWRDDWPWNSLFAYI